MSFACTALACRKPSPTRDAAPTSPPHNVLHTTHAARATADAEPASVRPRVMVPPGLPRPDAGTVRRTTVARTAVTNTDDPWTLVPSPEGALWIRAVNTRGQRASEIQATVFGHDGVASGPPRLLRRTTGPVRAISAEARDTHVWVAWHTVRGEEIEDDDTPQRREHIVAALHGNSSLTEVDATLTLADFSRVASHGVPYGWGYEDMVRAFVRDDGGLLAVYTGPRTQCVHDEDTEHSERVPCDGWNVVQIDSSGARHVKTEATLCASSLPRGFVRIPRGIAYALVDDHIGTKLLFYTEATGSATPMSLPEDTELWHYVDPIMAWGDGTFALTGVSNEDLGTSSPSGTHGVLVRGSTPATQTPALRDRYNSPMLPAFRRGALRCEQGHPVVHVSWARGPAQGVSFDVTHPGTSIDLVDWIDVQRLPLPSHSEALPTALVWTGAALLGIANGTPIRWTCAADGALRLASR
jgi:hypothetical protein